MARALLKGVRMCVQPSRLVLSSSIWLIAIGCAAPTPTTGAGHKAGDTERTVVDLAALNEEYPGAEPLTDVADAFRVRIKAERHELVADTHLFGPVNIIPFSDSDGQSDVDGRVLERGDTVLAQYFRPGDIGIGVMHHRAEHRTINFNDEGLDEDTLKEHFKFQDSHIEILVGVEDRDGAPGVVSLNNPQNYQNGRFGTGGYYPMVFRPTFPESLTPEEVRAYRDNIRTMVLAFNAVSHFAFDYNGGDPLAANTPDKVREHTAMMIRAIAGDADAQAWFAEPAHQVYCAELAYLGFSAGMIVPLNEGGVAPLIEQGLLERSHWERFKFELQKHNFGELGMIAKLFIDEGERDDPRRELLRNPYMTSVELTLAPDSLNGFDRLAFTPLTMADIVEQFLRQHIPRQLLGEQLAPLQGRILAKMRPALFESMGLNLPSASVESRIQAERLFGAIVGVVETPHADYAAFRATLAPLLEQARAATGPRDDTGTGHFVPPSLMHLVAKGTVTGLLGMEYVGHALELDLVHLPDHLGTRVDVEPPPVPSCNNTIQEPTRGTALRSEIMAAIHAEIDPLLYHLPNQYLVDWVRATPDAAFVRGSIQGANGNNPPINWRETTFSDAVYDGTFDLDEGSRGPFYALLRRDASGQWAVQEKAIGASDVGWWGAWERHSCAPAGLFQ